MTSIYLQQELSTLSRNLLYAGFPAVGVAIAALLVITVPTNAPYVAIDPHLLLLVTLPVELVPLSIQTAFFLRTATVTRLTAATFPFTTPEQER